MEGLGLRTIDYILLIVAFIGGMATVIKVFKDYQDRKLAEATVKAKENKAGETELQKIHEELKRIEDKVDDVDSHCEQRDKQQREIVANFFQQTFTILNNR